MADPCTRAASQYANGDIKRALSNIKRCQKDLQSKIKKFKNHPEARPQLLESLARAYRFEGQVYFGEHNVGKAHSAFTSALQTINKITQSNKSLGFRGHINYSLAIIALMRKQTKVGITLLEAAKDDFFESDTPEQGLEILLRLGGVYRDLRNFDKALEYFESVEINRKKTRDKTNRRIFVGRSKLEQGKILHGMEEDRAEKQFKKAKKEFRKAKFDEGVAQVLIEMAKIHQQHPEKAKEFLLEARDLGKVVDSAEIQGMALTQLGVLSLKLGQFNDGKQQLLDGLKYRSEAGDTIGTAQTLVELSRITMITSRNDDELQNAKTFAEQALGLYEQEDHEYGLATTFELLGSINTKLKNLDQAKSQIQEGKSIYAKYDDEQAEARMLTQLAIIYDQEERPEKAITVLEKAVSVFKKQDNSQGLAEALQILGLQYRATDPQQAVEYLQESKQIYSKIIGDNPGMQVILHKIDEVINSLKDQNH